MMRIRHLTVLAAIALLTAIPAIAKVAPENWNPPLTTAQRAVGLFVAVCGKSLPDFANAEALMANYGIVLTSRIGTATKFSTIENVSFQIQPHMGGNHCSMVFETGDSQAAVKKAFSAIGKTKVVNGNLAASYGGRAVAVLETTSSPKAYHLFMLGAP